MANRSKSKKVFGKRVVPLRTALASKDSKILVVPLSKDQDSKGKTKVIPMSVNQEEHLRIREACPDMNKPDGNFWNNLANMAAWGDAMDSR